MTLALALRQICCDRGDAERRAIFQCRAKYPEFVKLHTAARYDQIEGLAGEAVSRMSASLIGLFGSSAFRLSTAAVSMSLAGSCFSPELAPGPFHHGVRERGGPIYWAALPSD